MRVNVSYHQRRARHTALGTLAAVLVCVPWALYALGRAVSVAVRDRGSRERRPEA